MRYYEAPEHVKHWSGLDPADEPGPPNHDDACMVCDRIECVCPPEEDEPPAHITRADLQTTGEKIPFFRRRKT